ncbi:17015_t:CDS:10 [Gigaspora margarita]|uniref:3-dehydrosphinganine reductase n=1 Tax=Gigaspora margarita TaxID=4874 RepID=A0ABN7V0G4_GIGMA|nr:17015_t:CDS:10 [Gigaspora margarita]
MWSLTDYILQFTPYAELSSELHPVVSIVVTFLVFSVGYLMANSLLNKILRMNKFQPKGKHIYITGGSKGLGKEFAKLMASKGAHVTISARGKGDLDLALEEIKEAAQSRGDYENLKFNVVSADLSKYDDSIRALDEASSKHDERVPDVIICNAGISLPGIFIERPIDEYEKTMQLNYFGALYTTHVNLEAAKRMAQQGVKGKIVMVSSVAGLCGFLGYSSYAPTKHALRGLAECLRHELILYDISVHCYFAGTIDTPSYKEEEKIKPKITKDIEGHNALTPKDAAKALYKGICKGNFFITSDIIGDAMRASALGISPSNNAFFDGLLCGITWLVSRPARWYFDKMVRDSKATYSVVPADNVNRIN